MMKENSVEMPSAIFEMEGMPRIKEVIPLGFQHVVAAIVGVVTPALLVASVTGLDSSDRTILVQISLIITALATMIQLYPIGGIGSGLPVIIGISFAYVPTILAIGGQFGIAAIFGAQIAGGIAAFIVGIYVKQLRKFFPPIVTGTVIFTIGLSLYPVAIKYMAGGAGTPNFGSPENWMISMITFGVVVFLTYFTKGFMKLAAILIGMIVGYIISFMTGMISFDAVSASGWFKIVAPMHFGIEFEVSSIISMIIIYIVNAVQAIGDLSSTTIGGLDRDPTDKELSGGIKANGITSVISAFFGGLPTATFSQNVGIVTVNRVVNKMVFVFAAIVFLIAGLIPKFASLLTTIPQAVIGGATISVFAMITMTGIKMISSSELTPRNTAVVGLAVALGVGVTSVPGALDGFPAWVGTVFGSSSVVISTLTAIILNLILPKDELDCDVQQEN
ncbi:nucleobase:cation symporter-2 family protein [Tissierella sp. MB52-C2]|uniref:uracil-xanthine permease family protein n=1 Tax=Tissierella sp. MB52-C2 TaxID=3070999 RepID=UPI00280A9CD7|nr:nucleobase:cation symporter-2 family protein [Tissierella sp. MB52-C2]WMM25448.1 nucleobase:cation symporter-2 family protein [Tissierella sp. MB52-C2]